MKQIVKEKIERSIETRSMPSLVEQRNTLLDQMDALVNGVKMEQRAMSDEELQTFEDVKKQIEGLNKTIAALDAAKDVGEKTDVPAANTEGEGEEDKTEAEERAFVNHIRGIVETRADVNLTTNANGAIIPTSIANKIIERVQEISPIYQLATRYNVSGNLAIPYYDEESGTIEVAYVEEFQELESSSAKFASIELKGFLAGALSKISKSLVNNSNFKLVPYIVNKVAKALAKWIEKELLNGTDGKITGLSSITDGQTVTAAAATVITSDELMDVQDTVPDEYQGDAIWIMNRKTRSALRKLKDQDGNYLLNRDLSAKWNYTLLGKDVYTSANMPTMESGETAIYYGDMSGLAVKVSEEVAVQVLHEKYATQHAIGVVAYVELDSKIENAQMISCLKMA